MSTFIWVFTTYLSSPSPSPLDKPFPLFNTRRSQRGEGGGPLYIKLWWFWYLMFFVKIVLKISTELVVENIRGFLVIIFNNTFWFDSIQTSDWITQLVWEEGWVIFNAYENLLNVLRSNMLQIEIKSPSSWTISCSKAFLIKNISNSWETQLHFWPNTDSLFDKHSSTFGQTHIHFLTNTDPLFDKHSSTFRPNTDPLLGQTQLHF